MRWLLLGLMLALAGCPTTAPSCPTIGFTRCQGQRAQICQADGTWGTIEDCDRTTANTGTPWVCCFFPGDGDAGWPAGNTCLAPAECAGYGDAGVGP